MIEAIFFPLCLYVILLSVISGAGQLRQSLKTKPNIFASLPPRKADTIIPNFLALKLILAIAIIAYFLFTDADPSDFGFANLGLLWPLAFLAGVAAYFVFIYAYTAVTQLSGIHDTLVAEAYAGARSLWPRSARKQNMLRAVLTINPFTEELVYRGVLVYYAGNLFERPITFIVVGLAVCLLAHVYQGLRMLWFHFGFYFLAIVLLFSPLGIVGAFGAHLAGDYYPLTKFREQMNAYRSERRRLRPIAHSKTTHRQ